MATDRINEGIAAYMGVSSPETPKYLLANNFLMEYFAKNENASQVYNFLKFKEKNVLHCEDDVNQGSLQKSFDVFLNRYLGAEIIADGSRRVTQSSSNKHYYFPIIQDMLIGSPYNLRHLLYHLQFLDENGFDHKLMADLLEDYIFHDNTGINKIFKILFQTRDDQVKHAEIMPRETHEAFWAMLALPQERTRMEHLGRKLNEDLRTLLRHDYFRKLDFYRRYNYLAILLTSYVIQYIVQRNGSNIPILCKGAPLDNRLDGAIHRACCGNYADIRMIFPKLLQQYYRETLGRELGENCKLSLLAGADRVWVGEKEFNAYLGEVFGSKFKQPIPHDDILKAFSLEVGQRREIEVDDFAFCYIGLTGTRRGSTLTKISSVLPTCGRQIDMIYPQNNSKQKYFAMSGVIAEFYVRLYLAGEKRSYDYLDNFMEYLQNRYQIVIAKMQGSDKLLRNVKFRLSALDFAKNRGAFIDTLSSINCLIKLSDSGYVVTLPEEKGRIKLI